MTHHVQHHVLRPRLLDEENEGAKERDGVEDAGVDDDQEDGPDGAAPTAPDMRAALGGPETIGKERWWPVSTRSHAPDE